VTTESTPVELNARKLRRWPLPAIPHDADKEDRGRVLVVAGSREIPGAALLAGTAALRAGAGKLVIATARSVAAAVGVAMPEARVIGLPETPSGAFDAEAAELLAEAAQVASAALVGPGLMGPADTTRFVARLLPRLAHASLVLDALAMDVLRETGAFTQPVLLSPHAGEMAGLCACHRAEVEHNATVAVERARAWHAVVVLKGATTRIAAPDGRTWQHSTAQPGLATSGSGDVLAGIVAGLAARGAPLEQAGAWGVVVHALAGARLARRLDMLGLLARELPGEVPGVIRRLR
jgi:ADP-dependent NAD(P)H-hydrate dehydratase